MKVNNLNIFDNNLEGEILLRYLKIHGIYLNSKKEENKLKEEKKLLEETFCLKSLIKSLLLEDERLDLSNFINGFNIPQINNEFDLLRFGKQYDINIELKKINTGKKIIKQLNKQKHYLSIRDKELWQFCYVKDENQLYETDGEELFKSSFQKLINLLYQQKIELVDPEKLFEPAKFLISPFNTPDKFMNSNYFLNSYQDDIKRDIILSKEKYHVVTGIAGSVKTLLVYDIAKQLMKMNKKVTIIHAGNLNDGQIFLNNNGWDIRAAKEHVSSNDIIDVLIIDESQRHHKTQFTSIIGFQDSLALNKIILCGDDEQILSEKNETYNISEKIKENEQRFVYHKLTKKVRTNKNVADFIKGLFDLKNMKKIDRNSISIDYFENKESVSKHIQYLNEKENSVFLNYTLPPSGGNYGYDLFQDFKDIRDIYIRIDSKTPHEVIGQEFDIITVCLGPHFRYEQGKLIFPNDKTNYYSVSKMLFQNLTRSRKKINFIIFNNQPLLKELLGAIT